LALFGRIDQTGHVSVRVFVLVHELVGLADSIEAKRARQTGIEFARNGQFIDRDRLLVVGPISGTGRTSRCQASFGSPNRFWRIQKTCMFSGTTPSSGRFPNSQISGRDASKLFIFYLLSILAHRRFR
jgi:hypothetical protein